MIGSHFLQDPKPTSAGELVHQFAEVTRFSNADLLLETFDASGIALHGGLNRRIRDAQMIAFGQDQAAIRLFDPHLGAMAGVN